MKAMTIILALAVMGAVSVSTATADAQKSQKSAKSKKKKSDFDQVMGMRVDTFLRLGFGGENKGKDALAGRTKAKTTVGIGGRFEVPIHEYFTAGPQLSLYSVKSEGFDRDFAFDLGGFAKGRYPFKIKEYQLEVYLLFPLGLTIIADDRRGRADGAGVGYHLGLLPGIRMFPWERVGWLFELGWGYAWVRWKAPNRKGSVATSQAAMNIGVVIVLN